MNTENNIDELKPLTLSAAAEALRTQYPHFYFTESQLRTMCIKRLVPHLELPTCGRLRRVRYMVRVRELVNHFKKQYRPA